jgi:hypothetical protein
MFGGPLNMATQIQGEAEGLQGLMLTTRFDIERTSSLNS